MQVITTGAVPLILPIDQSKASYGNLDELKEEHLHQVPKRIRAAEEKVFLRADEMNFIIQEESDDSINDCADVFNGKGSCNGAMVTTPDSSQAEQSHGTILLAASENRASSLTTDLPLHANNLESAEEAITMALNPTAVLHSALNTQGCAASESEPSAASELDFSDRIDAISDSVSESIQNLSEHAEEGIPAGMRFFGQFATLRVSEADIWSVLNKLGPRPALPEFMRATSYSVFERARKMANTQFCRNNQCFDSEMLMMSCPMFASKLFTLTELHFYTAVAEIRAYITGDFASFRERFQRVRFDSSEDASGVVVEELPPWCIPNVNGRVVHDENGLAWEWGVRNGARFCRVPTWEKAFEILHPDLYALVLRDRSQHDLIRRWDSNADEILLRLLQNDYHAQMNAPNDRQVYFSKNLGSLNFDGVAGIENSSKPKASVAEVDAATSSVVDKEHTQVVSSCMKLFQDSPGRFPRFNPSGLLCHDNGIGCTLHYLKFRPQDANIPMNQMLRRLRFAQMCYFIQRRAETRPIVKSHGLPVPGSVEVNAFLYQFCANQNVHGTAFTNAVRVIRNYLSNRCKSSYSPFIDIIRDGYTLDEASRKRWQQLLAIFDDQYRTSKRISQKDSRDQGNRSVSITEPSRQIFRPTRIISIP